ncbi:hypothetical protein LINPERHAP2_LOCUS18052 [Linum perenne]
MMNRNQVMNWKRRRKNSVFPAHSVTNP